MQPVVIACGDHAGIGPEVALKAASAFVNRGDGDPGVVLVGDRAELAAWGHRLGIALANGEEGKGDRRLRVVDPRPRPLGEARAPMNPETALASLDYLRRGAEGCLKGEFSALVTAPVSKEAILRAGVAFVGQTEWLAGLSGGIDVTMMLLGDDPAGRWLRVALATTHLPLAKVAGALRTTAIERAIRHAREACDRLGLPRARIGVCGLNPHAGEGGMLGDEEARIIAPAIARARGEGADVHGPLPGDTVFYEAFRGRYDVVVAMYHDQGLAPLKVVAFDSGVNWTLGLPFIRTSPDHGTAFDLAGRGVANPSSMEAALRMAVRLAGAANCGGPANGSAT